MYNPTAVLDPKEANIMLATKRNYKPTLNSHSDVISHKDFRSRE